MQSDSGMFGRIARGDAAAVDACLDRYGDLVWTLAKRYLSSFGMDMEDAVQEVFISIWRSASKFDSTKGSEAAFVATIAHRRLNDQRRKAMSRAGNLPVAHEAPPAEIKTQAGLKDESLAAADAYARLADDERQVLWLSVQQGLSHERIAQTTGMSIGVVKSRLRQAVVSLRRLMAEHTSEKGGAA